MKPCLDPYDPECPKTAPNYKTKKVILLFLLEVPVKHLHYKRMAILAISRRDEEKPCIGVNSAGGMGILWKIGKEMVMEVEFPTKVVKNSHV